MLVGQRWALRVDQFGQGVVFLLCFWAEMGARVNRTSGHSISSLLEGQRRAPSANQFSFIIQLSFFHGTEVGTKSESIRNTTEFLSCNGDGHQERINSYYN